MDCTWGNFKRIVVERQWGELQKITGSTGRRGVFRQTSFNAPGLTDVIHEVVEILDRLHRVEQPSGEEPVGVRDPGREGVVEQRGRKNLELAIYLADGAENDSVFHVLEFLSLSRVSGEQVRVPRFPCLRHSGFSVLSAAGILLPAPPVQYCFR